MVGAERPYGLQGLYLFVADALGLEGLGRLHSDQREHLEHMALEHIAQGAGLVVIAGAMLDAQRLGDGNLNVVDVIAVPERLENDVGEAEHQDVLDGLFAEVMVDAVNLGLLEAAADFVVQFNGAGEVPSKRFFDDQAGRVFRVGAGRPRQAGHAKILDDYRIEKRRNGQIKYVIALHPVGFVELIEPGLDIFIKRRVVVITFYVI